MKSIKKKKTKKSYSWKVVRMHYNNYCSTVELWNEHTHTHIYPAMQATRSLHSCIQYATPTFGCPHHCKRDHNALAPHWFHFHSTRKTRTTQILQTRQFLRRQLSGAICRHCIASDKTKEKITQRQDEEQQKTIAIGDASATSINST